MNILPGHHFQSEELYQWITIVFITLCFVVVDNIHRFRISKLEKQLGTLMNKYKAIDHLISAETDRREAHTKAFRELTDPNVIAVEMEKSAQAVEMANAKRRTQVRPDGGPPAKIHQARNLRQGPL